MKSLLQAGFVYKTALWRKGCMGYACIILTTGNSRRTPLIFRPTGTKNNDARWRMYTNTSAALNKWFLKCERWDLNRFLSQFLEGTTREVGVELKIIAIKRKK